jgi:hypothetical protein
MSSGEGHQKLGKDVHWRANPRAQRIVGALVLAMLFALGAFVLPAHEPDALHFDPVSSLAIEPEDAPAPPLPTNAHPYPEALAQADEVIATPSAESDSWRSSADSGSAARAWSGERRIAPGAVVAGLLLTAEQIHVARFFADKYRQPIEDVVEVVAFAYLTAREARIDPFLVLSVISIESGFNPRARSLQGAEGLMQVRTLFHEEKFQPFGGPRAAFDPEANIRVGVTILRNYLLREGSVEAALKAYVGAARRSHDGGYGRKVMGERDQLHQVLAARLQDGLNVSSLTRPQGVRPL